MSALPTLLPSVKKRCTPETPDRPYGALGVRTDTVTGLYYMRHRWYDSSLQRFISRDPIGLSGGENVYTYAGNSPTIFVDPMGLKKFDVYDCLGDCMEKYDPTNLLGRTVLNWTNMPIKNVPPIFPDLWPQRAKDFFATMNALGQKAVGTGATSPLLIAGNRLSGNAGAAIRGLGQVGFHVRLLYGNYMAVVEISCLLSCLKKNYDCKGSLDPQLYYFFLGLRTYLQNFVEYVVTPIPGSVDWGNWDGRITIDGGGDSITIDP